MPPQLLSLLRHMPEVQNQHLLSIEKNLERYLKFALKSE